MTTNRLDTSVVLDHDFLEIRTRLLDLGAALDRLDRAQHPRVDRPDARLAQIRQAIEALLEPGPGRAETVQHLFSLPYDSQWREHLHVRGGPTRGMPTS